MKFFVKNSLLLHGIIWSSALIVRLSLVSSHGGLQGDELSYHALANSLEEGKGYGMEGQTYSRPPVYPLFVASVYRIFGKGNVKAVYVIQAVLGALICNLVYEMSKRLFGFVPALLSAFLVTVNMPLAASSSRLLSECLFTVFLMGGFFLLQNPTRKTVIFSGVLLAMAAMTRGIVLYLPFLLGFIFMISGGKEGLQKGGLLIGAFLVAMIPLTMRNYFVYHAFVPVSTQGGYVFYTSYHPKEGKFFGYNVKDAVTDSADQLTSETKRNDYFYRRTVEDIRKNPRGTLRLEILKFLYFWVPFDWEILGKGRYHFVYAFVFPMIFLGIFWAKGRRLFLLTPLFYFLGMSLIFYGSPRFRLPVEPFLMILGAFGLVELFRRLPRRSLGWIFTATLLTANAGVAVFQDPLKRVLMHSLHGWGLW